jgi:DNA-binding CsgD family transcriptional regulator
LRGEEALVLLDLGRAYRQASQRGKAKETLERAAQMAQECQMHRSAGEAVEELRVLGARPRRLAFSGVDSLTASERRVAQLAADGATNREIAQRLFITVKTVDSHLTRTYRKLGISSRRELAVALG